MTRFSGSGGIIGINPGTSSTGSSVGNLTEWEIDLKRDRQEVTAMGDANKSYIMGLPDVSGSFSGFMSTSVIVQAASRSVAASHVIIWPTTESTAIVYSGMAHMDMNVSGGVSKALAMKGTFVAAGDWTLPSTATT